MSEDRERGLVTLEVFPGSMHIESVFCRWSVIPPVTCHVEKDSNPPTTPTIKAPDSPQEPRSTTDTGEDKG